jgi:hypothetical protein
VFETDFWVVVQTAALVTAGFGVWILARACWDYAGLPSVHDAYLQAVERRLRELDAVLPSRGLGFRAVLAGGDRPRGGSGGTPALDSGSAPSGSLARKETAGSLGRKEAEYVPACPAVPAIAGGARSFAAGPAASPQPPHAGGRCQARHR